MTKKVVLFVGHGSRLEAGNEEVREFVKQLSVVSENE